MFTYSNHFNFNNILPGGAVKKMHPNMKFEQLEYFGIPRYLINIWKEHYSDFLLPVQEKAIRQSNLLSSNNTYNYYQTSSSIQKNNKNLLVLSPSSSGKTLIGEMAALQEITLQKKVIYLVPLRVLAEEKYRQFKQLYHCIGLNVKLSSRDHRYDDEDIIRGNFHMAVIVYEKFYYLLLQYPKFMANVSLIITDEIQLINNPERGPKLESSFNYLKNNYSHIRIIALSAFTEYLLPLTRWLEAKLLISFFRPVELRKGIVRKGVYQYVEHNSKAGGEELFFSPEAAEECSLASYLKSTLQFLLGKQETSLIFFSTKKEARLWSKWLAAVLCLKPASTALEKLQALEDSTSKEELLNLLQNGVGYHCADLTLQERHALEEAVRAGELKVICATGTLAMGVNLPVNNVILTGQKIVSQQSLAKNYGSNGFRHYRKEVLTSSEVENIGGRAGRLNSVNSFGRIIFLAPSLLEFTAYQRLYFSKEAFGLPTPSHSYFPALSNAAADRKMFNDYTLAEETDMASSVINDHPYAGTFQDNPVAIQQDLLTFLLYKIAFECKSIEDIKYVLQTGKNKTTPIFWLHQFSEKYDESAIIASLKRLEQKGLIVSPILPTEKNYQISEMGQLVTAKGITFQTYTHFLKWINNSEKESISELEILFLIAASDDGRLFLTGYSGSGSKITKIKNKKSVVLKWQEYLRLRLLSQIFERGEEGKPIFQYYLNADTLRPQLSSSQNQPKMKLNSFLAIKNTLLMYDWINVRELREIEEDYGILGGGIQKIGEGFSWLADTLAAIAGKLGWKEERVSDLEMIQQLSARLITGIRPEGLPLAKLQIPELTRGYINRLLQEGYNRKDCLREVSENQLQQLLPKLLVKKIKGVVSPSENVQLPLKPEFSLMESLGNIGTAAECKLEKSKNYHEQNPFQENSLTPVKNNLSSLEKSVVLTIDLNRPDRLLFLQGEVEVNKTGFQLMLLLAKNKGKVLSYEQIIDYLWPSDMDATYHRLWYHLAKLRNSMKRIIQRQGKQIGQDELNRPAITFSFLKEKMFKIIPGRGLLLDAEVLLEIKE